MNFFKSNQRNLLVQSQSEQVSACFAQTVTQMYTLPNTGVHIYSSDAISETGFSPRPQVQ